jgi:pimeloyl-ACP methyl ester carboxylesterase
VSNEQSSSAREPILICLHGWGGSKESFTELRAALAGTNITILTPDLPGFGAEPEPDRAWSIDDYADWVEHWIEESQPIAKSQKPIAISLLGHSHGGRIALKLAHRQSAKSQKPIANSQIAHLYLCASAGIHHPKHIRRAIGLTLAKSGKVLLSIPGLRVLNSAGKKLLYKVFRVHDFEHASPVMRDTMIRVVREDLRTILSSIKIPTDIFWGTADRMTPYSDALVMEREIPGAVLHTFPGGTHRIHRDNAREIAAVIQSRMAA